MAKYQDKTAVLDAKLDVIIDQATQIHLLSAYTPGDSYATVVANSLASTTIAPGNWTKSDYGTNGRKVVMDNNKSGVASASTTGVEDLHIALLDAVNSVVVHVTDETTDQIVYAGNPVYFGALEIRENQPV